MAAIDMTGQELSGETNSRGVEMYIVGEHPNVLATFDLVCRCGKGGGTIEELMAKSCALVENAPYVESTAGLDIGKVGAEAILFVGYGGAPSVCSCTPSNGPDCHNCA